MQTQKIQKYDEEIIMSNFNKSDYAANKYSDSIVYKSVTGAYELTEEQFLRENPSETPQTYRRWKIWSNHNYLKMLRKDIEERKHTVPWNELEDTLLVCAAISEDESFKEVERQNNPTPTIKEAYDILNSCLTEIQKRRFLLFILERKNEREIALLEGVNQSSVSRSLIAAQKRINRYVSKNFEELCIEYPDFRY